MNEEQRAVTLSGKVIIGLTGNIATGKTAVMRLAAERDALTIDADKVVHDLMDQNRDLQAAIAVAFGPAVRRADGRIDRRELGKIVFQDLEAMQDLEEMVHPLVGQEIARRITESDAAVIMIEAIKLLEGNLVAACHQIWVTRCAPQKQLERLRVCRGMETQTAVARIKAQSSQEEKVAQADVVIDTNGFMRETETQFEMAWSRLPEPHQAVPTRLVIRPAPPPPRQSPSIGQDTSLPAPETAAPPPEPVDRPDDLEVRRARPSDIAAMLLLIQKATDGAVQLKRAELLMALSERGYFIGQVGAEISALVGWNIDSQIARIDQIFIHPLVATATTGVAVLEEIEKSANAHICEIILAFLPQDAPAPLRQLLAQQGFETADKEDLPAAWQQAIDESQPDDSYFLIKVLRDQRLNPR